MKERKKKGGKGLVGEGPEAERRNSKLIRDFVHIAKSSKLLLRIVFVFSLFTLHLQLRERRGKKEEKQMVLPYSTAFLRVLWSGYNIMSYHIECGRPAHGSWGYASICSLWRHGYNYNYDHCKKRKSHPTPSQVRTIRIWPRSCIDILTSLPPFSLPPTPLNIYDGRSVNG